MPTNRLLNPQEHGFRQVFLLNLRGREVGENFFEKRPFFSGFLVIYLQLLLYFDAKSVQTFASCMFK